MTPAEIALIETVKIFAIPFGVIVGILILFTIIEGIVRKN